MAAKLEFGCLPTAIGSMPHTNPVEACSTVMKYLPEIPVWPQLPKRCAKEDMIIQFSEGFPGVVIHGSKIYIERSADFESKLAQIYVDCETDNVGQYGISSEYAAGLYAFLSEVTGNKLAKGQITGPITWGLRVTGQDGSGILYDDTLAEAAAKFLRLKALWQTNMLRQVAPNTIMFIDEPCLVSLGSVFAPIPEEKVPILLKEVFRGIKGVKGLHCCGNTNWSVILDTSIDILSFDAYSYALSLGTHSEKVKCFFEGGGCVAWGIVPTDEEALARESLSSLLDRLGEAMALFTRDGLKFKQIVAQGLLTPSCGLAGLSAEGATEALELTAKLSHQLRSRYGL